TSVHGTWKPVPVARPDLSPHAPLPCPEVSVAVWPGPGCLSVLATRGSAALRGDVAGLRRDLQPRPPGRAWDHRGSRQRAVLAGPALKKHGWGLHELPGGATSEAHAACGSVPVGYPCRPLACPQTHLNQRHGTRIIVPG